MADSAASQETGFQAPTYTISLISDGTLQFDPPQDSPELAIALSLAFPRPRTLDEKMREAQLLFLQTRYQTTAHAVQQRAITPTQISMSTQPTAQVQILHLKAEQASQEAAQFHLFDSSMQEPATSTSSQSANKPKSKKRAGTSRAKAASQLENLPTQNQFVWDLRSGITQKRTRRTLGEAEAVQVFENRGNVCDYHKATRTKCDPTNCPRNKLFQRTMLRSQPLVFETFSKNSSSVHGTETCHLQGCKATAEHSHPLSLYPPPAIEGRNAIAAMNASIGVPSPVPIQYSDKPLGQEVRNWPREWSENDGMAFQQELDEFHSSSNFNNVVPPSDSSMSLCGRCNLIHELAPGSPSEPICELAQFSSSFEIDAETEEEKKKKKKDPDKGSLAYFGGGNGGGGNGGGGFGKKDGRGGKDGDGGRDGGATGGASGSGGNGSSYDPFWGSNGDGDGWYSSMVAVFMLAWLALQSLLMATLARPSTDIKHLNEAMNPSISNKNVGVIDNNHWSNGRGGDDEEDDDAARGAGCSGNVLTTDLDSQLDGLSLTAAANHLFNPATTPSGPLDKLPVLFKTPEASLLLPYPHRLSIVSSTIFTILSRVHSKTRTKSKTKATSTSRSTCTLSTLDHQHDLQALVDPSRSGSLCVSSAVRAF
ncbi:hypothetical protein V502_07890 [Pseudogymnoascus sp. VKM F-4520 (FW-2644)]|nr:hypothetical protein V502_07890 [Pseudogymnoascus sp. VKM F-4520 (FW-2644)]